MRGAVRHVVNRALGTAGVRLVSTEWGPRGFADALARIKQQGIVPRQIVDIGAAGGTWTEACLRIFPDAHYFLVDPLDENQTALAALAAHHPNVKAWRGALGAADGELELHVHGDQSSFLSSEYSDRGALRKVPVRTLDSFLGTDWMSARPDVIKADVQGYELEVLAGATRSLEAAEFLLLEVSFRRVYAGCPLAHEVIAFAGRHGFRVYDICSYAQRPRDGELVQADVLFAKDGSKVFAFEGYQ